MIPLPDIQPGDKIRLAHGGNERRWWDVRTRDERFIVLTRQAPFQPKGDVEYTIIDGVRDLRGPCNLIGQGWHKTMPDEECARLLRALNAHLEFQAYARRQNEAGDRGPWERPDEPMVEVSYRNNVPVLVTERKAA